MLANCCDFICSSLTAYQIGAEEKTGRKERKKIGDGRENCNRLHGNLIVVCSVGASENPKHVVYAKM